MRFGGLPCDGLASHPGEGKAFFEVPLLKGNLPPKIISLGVYYLD